MIFAHWQCSSDSIKQKLPSSCQTSQKEINIAFPPNSIFQNTHLLAQVCKMNAEELYIGFNRQSHRLEWFGLNDEEVKGFVKVPKVGPNEIPLVHSFYFHNQDSIFIAGIFRIIAMNKDGDCLLYTSPSPRDATLSRMPSSA